MTTTSEPLKVAKIAICHDWLIGDGGAERHLEAICRLFPRADIYTSVYQPGKAPAYFTTRDIKTSFINRLPFFKSRHRLSSGLRSFYWQRLDLSDYDLIISSSGSEAKGVRSHRNQLHINVCYSPSHYYWSHYQDYLKHPGLGNAIYDFLAKVYLRLFIRLLRKKDWQRAQRPDLIIANSKTTQARIKKYYQRQSIVVYPPVALADKPVSLKGKKVKDYYIMLGRHVPYKGFDLAVMAFSDLEGKKLSILGTGPLTSRLKAIAKDNIEFLGYVDEDFKIKWLKQAKACLFLGVDDFGLVPVEAMALGTPVIALRAGGALETVLENKTGIFLDRPTVVDLKDALERFEKTEIKASDCRRQALKFQTKKFQAKFLSLIEESFREFKS